MSRRFVLLPTFIAASLLAAASVPLAQTDRSFPACPTQQKLEQVTGSEGKFVPEDCRKLTVTRVRSGTSELCVLDFETSGDKTFIDRLRSAAVPTQWWVSCENLSRR
jgi:hypothetical protein